MKTKVLAREYTLKGRGVAAMSAFKRVVPLKQFAIVYKLLGLPSHIIIHQTVQDKSTQQDVNRFTAAF